MPLRQELGTLGGLDGTTRLMAAGTNIYRQGESCAAYFVVLRGWISLSVLLDDGENQILDFALPGSFLGFPLASTALTYHSARCLTPVSVCSYPRRQLDNAIQRNSRLAFLLCRIASLDESRAHDHLVNVGLRSARERIAHLIVELYVRLRGGLPITTGEMITIPLTQTQIGQAVGLTGVHVSRTLRTLREQRIAQFAGSNLLILDPSALVRAAGMEHLSHCRAQDPRTTPSRSRPAADARSSYRIPTGWELPHVGAGTPS